MSKENSTIRKQLEKIYGKGCMFQKAHIAERLENIEGILSYSKYKTRFKLKEIKRLEANMTLHHLKHKFEKGKTTVENGAIVNELAHRYLHNGLTRQQEEVANNMLREFKEEIPVIEVDDLDVGIEIKTAVITPEDLIPQYNRAKVKRETRKMYKEYEGR